MANDIKNKHNMSFNILGAALIILVSGCAPTNPVMPYQSLEPGETYSSIHVTLPFNNFAHFSLQWSIAHGVGENDMLGCTLSNLLIPASLNYAHRLSSGRNHESVQVFLNLSSFNPLIEIDYLLSNTDDETTNAVRIGAGINVNLFPLYYKHWNFRVIPIVEYTFRHRDMHFSAGTRIGLTRAIINNERYLREDVRYEYSESEIDTVLIETTTRWNEYGILLNDGRMLNIRNRDPYADCMSCGLSLKIQNAYTASKIHRAYWVYFSSEYNPSMASGPARILQLNMSEIIARMQTDGKLIVSEDVDVLERTEDSFNPWIEDLYLDLGYDHQHKD